MTALLRANGLSVRYGRQMALEDVSFEVPPGEIVAVVGPNGAGKTTLFKAALGALAPTLGTIEGAPAAYVPQSDGAQLHYPLTALDVALMGGYRRRAWWQPLGRALRHEALAQLERVGLGSRAHVQFGELSGGQRQRVLLARALLSRRSLLLLDEPLNGVDATTQEVVVGLLEELRREGRSLLVSTHDLTLARRISTRMLFLHRRLVAYGPTGEAFTAEALRQTFAGSLLVVEPHPGELVELIDVGAHGLDPELDGVSHLLHAAYEPFELGLMQRALLELVVVGAVSGAVGCLVVLRGLSFTGESLAHTVLPGLVLAYALGVSLLLGAAALAAVTVVVALVAQRDARISDDTAMGVAFAGLFPLGVILLALQEHPTRSLSDFLFGDVLANSPDDVRATLVLAVLIGVGLVVCLRSALATSFDRSYAATLGYRPQLVDAVLLSLVAATVVVAMMTVGNVLALALLVTPAAAARLLVGRVLPMLGLAAGLGAAAGVAALELSYWAGLAAGATVVLVAAGEFVACLAVAGARGVAATRS